MRSEAAASLFAEPASECKLALACYIPRVLREYDRDLAEAAKFDGQAIGETYAESARTVRLLLAMLAGCLLIDTRGDWIARLRQYAEVKE